MPRPSGDGKVGVGGLVSPERSPCAIESARDRTSSPHGPRILPLSSALLFVQAFSRDPKPFHFFVETLAGDAQPSGGDCAAALVAVERASDQPGFDLRRMHAQRKAMCGTKKSKIVAE